jgi:phenylpropionate dioxygenase-like ring-hydroxylating dioxygenase large terminal subunit
MKQQDVCALNRRLLQHVCDRSTDLAEQSLTVDAERFLDRQLWENERRQYFLDTPQVVGFSGEVAEPGSYLCVEVMQRPIIICRDSHGVLRAFLNACSHRGAQLAAGAGEARRFNCPYHGWSFRLDGALAGRPQAEAFDDCQGSNDLHALPVADNNGLLVVGLHNGVSQKQVDCFLDDITEPLSGFAFEEMRHLQSRRFQVAANWKLVADLSHEAYHFNSLHRESLAPVMHPYAAVDFFGRHSRWAFPFRDINTLSELDEAQWPARPLAAMNHTLFPSTVVIVTPEDAQLIRAEPGAAPETSVVHYHGVMRSAADRASSLAAYEFGGQIFETEDLPVAEQCQRALSAGLPSVLYGRNEPVCQFWHQQWMAGI